MQILLILICFFHFHNCCKNGIVLLLIFFYLLVAFGREIADILLAVNRAYNKSDYIPCIAWGRNARFSQNLEVGTKVKVVGRVQSREYEKIYEDGTSEVKVAYEVSIGSLEIVEENEEENNTETENVENNQEAV